MLIFVSETKQLLHNWQWLYWHMLCYYSLCTSNFTVSKTIWRNTGFCIR